MYLANALRHSNCKLQTLDLCNNMIGDDAVKHLADALRHSGCKLRWLSLDACNISDAGAEAFADVLRYDNRTLTTLDLYDRPRHLPRAQCKD